MPTNIKARLIREVERSLQSRNNTTTARYESLPPYVKCKLDPFNHKGSDGIPDHNSKTRVTVDHHGYVDFNIQNGNIVWRILPMMPFQAAWNTLNGQFTGIVGGQLIDITNPEWTNTWTPSIIPPEYNGVAIRDPEIGGSIGNPYGAVTARIVGIGWRLTYTGKALDATGVVNVRRIGTHLDSINTNSAQIRSTNITREGVAYTVPGDRVKIATIDFPPAFLLLTPDTIVRRPETNLNGVLTQQIIGEQCAFFEQPLIPVTSDRYPARGAIDANSGALFTTATSNVTNLNTTPAFSIFDPSYVMTEISMINCIGNYRLEVLTCMEYVPEPNSVMQSLARRPLPEDKFAISLANNVLKDTPAAATGLNSNPKVTAGHIQSAVMQDPAMIGSVISSMKPMKPAPQPVKPAPKPQRPVPVKKAGGRYKRA